MRYRLDLILLQIKYISSLLNDATPTEGKFVLKILLGVLRLGIAENTVMDALAITFTGKKENRTQIEDAYNVSSDLGKVSEIIAKQGIDGIKKFQITLFNPIRPMLADRVISEEEAIKKNSKKFAAEYKLDGERVQIHKKDSKIILFSRSLERITQYYPDIVENIGKSLATKRRNSFINPRHYASPSSIILHDNTRKSFFALNLPLIVMSSSGLCRLRPHCKFSVIKHSGIR